MAAHTAQLRANPMVPRIVGPWAVGVALVGACQLHPLSAQDRQVEVSSPGNGRLVAERLTAMEQEPTVRGVLANARRCFRHFEVTELRQLHHVVKLTKPEFLAIEAALQPIIDRALLQICQQRIKRPRKLNDALVWETYDGHRTPATIVQDGLIDITHQLLDADRYRAYKEQVVARRDYHRRAVVAAIAAALDSRLLLNEAQNRRLNRLLIRRWQDIWSLCLRELLQNGVEELPLLPKADITKLLTVPQQTLFGELPWRTAKAIPTIGPVDATVAGHRWGERRLVDVLEFTDEQPEAQP